MKRRTLTIITTIAGTITAIAAAALGYFQSLTPHQSHELIQVITLPTPTPTTDGLTINVCISGRSYFVLISGGYSKLVPLFDQRGRLRTCGATEGRL